MKAINRIEYG